MACSTQTDPSSETLLKLGTDTPDATSETAGSVGPPQSENVSAFAVELFPPGRPATGAANTQALSSTFSSYFDATSDEELRELFVMPEYLRRAVVAASKSKESGAPNEEQRSASLAAKAPLCPLVVMINSKSGSRLGPELRTRLTYFLTEDQVYDLSEIPPEDFVRYGLGCLEKFAENNDQCARDTRDRIRILVAGGDGTVGWILGCFGELDAEKRKPVPPIGIIPLGTGNDLARSFGWGGSFSQAKRSAVKKYILSAAGSKTHCLDSWQVVIKNVSDENTEFPHALHRRHQQKSVPEPKQEDDTDTVLPSDNNPEEAELPNSDSWEGVFYNYFSIGMDAQVAYGFHHLRTKAPYLARGPVANKLIYSGYGLTQGWLCTPCSANPRLRSLRNLIQMDIIRNGKSEWEQFELPPKVRAVVVLNLRSYASGRDPWGDQDVEYNETRGFVEPRTDDGLLEVLGLFDGWHAARVLINLSKAKHLVQASALRFEVRGGRRKRAYMQMDGEPWQHPLSADGSPTHVEISRVQNPSMVLYAH